MLNIIIVCVGKLKEPFLREAFEEYRKRLSTFCKLSVIELSPEKLSDSPSQKEIDSALTAEGKRILEKIPKGSAIYTMCIEGKQISSTEFSEKISSLAVSGFSSIAFVIGGSYGLSDEVKAKSSFKMSVSKMTFPHQLFRVMLMEQIYRALQIELGTKYHK